MKKIYLIAVVALFTTKAWSQAALSFSPKDTFYLTGTAADLLQADFKVKNNTSAALDITWTRVENNVTNGWDVSTCDPINCFPPNINSSKFTLGAGATGSMILDITPNELAGSGHFRIVFSAKGITAQTVGVYAVATKSVGTNDLNINKIALSPNPAQDFFSISNFDSEIKQLTLTNLTGSIVKTFNTNEGATYDISDLPRGTYFVSFLNQNGKRLGAKKLVKAN